MATKQINDLTAKAVPVSTDELVLQETGGGTTKKATLANLVGASTGLSITQTIWIPAVAMVARTTSGAAAGTAESTTNKVMINTYDFDASTDEFAQFAIRMPKNWDEGTVTAEFVWSAASSSGDVIWGLQGVALANDDAIDTAFGTAQTATDTLTATGDICISPTTAAITIAGSPGAEEYVVFQVYRDADAGGDTLAADARLHGITLNYTVNTLTDA